MSSSVIVVCANDSLATLREGELSHAAGRRTGVARCHTTFSLNGT
jgi:hypothetical protein